MDERKRITISGRDIRSRLSIYISRRQLADIKLPRFKLTQFRIGNIFAFQYREVVRPRFAIGISDFQNTFRTARHHSTSSHRSKAYRLHLRRTNQRAVFKHKIVQIALGAAVADYNRRTSFRHTRRIKPATGKPYADAVRLQIGNLKRTAPVVPHLTIFKNDAALNRRAKPIGKDGPDSAMRIFKKSAIAVGNIHFPAILLEVRDVDSQSRTVVAAERAVVDQHFSHGER